MAVSIKHWLGGKRDYKEGVELFEKNGGSAVFLNVFKAACNSYTKEKLTKELQKLIAPVVAAPVVEVPTIKATKEPTLSVTLQKSNTQAIYPAALQLLVEERYKFYREIEYMKNQLISSDKETRRVYCLRIVRQFQFIDKVWKAEQHFNATGVFIDFTDMSKDLRAKQLQLARKISNARINVSKHKKTGNKVKLDEWQGKFKALEAESKELLSDFE